MFKEVSVVQLREVLRRWLATGEGLRCVGTGAGVDRKTARRYIEAAESLGLGCRRCQKTGGAWSDSITPI